MDEQNLRKRINDQLGKLEITTQVVRAVFYGKNAQFHYAGGKSSRSQITANGSCKTCLCA
ncbi:hypothetical protein GCM10023185_40200 [Hymenobacter saemangeumensis]|uniref:Uncharacterized protein n=1 Tax=Hymenobacter saemangeumensis TaxID=1084522 RepID=A0ABP8IQZ3_9BACT